MGADAMQESLMAEERAHSNDSWNKDRMQMAWESCAGVMSSGLGLFSMYFCFMSTNKARNSLEIQGSCTLFLLCEWPHSQSQKCDVWWSQKLLFPELFFSSTCNLMLWGFAATLAALTVLMLILSLKGQLRSWPLLCQAQHEKRQSGKSEV